jgi:hypothetical protein
MRVQWRAEALRHEINSVGNDEECVVARPQRGPCLLQRDQTLRQVPVTDSVIC